MNSTEQFWNLIKRVQEEDPRPFLNPSLELIFEEIRHIAIVDAIERAEDE
jgi:hypothetical protein